VGRFERTESPRGVGAGPREVFVMIVRIVVCALALSAAAAAQDPPFGTGHVALTPEERALNQVVYEIRKDSVPTAFDWRQEMPGSVTGVRNQGCRAAFVRGTVTAGDAALDIADPICMLQYLFARGPAPDCMDAGDANDSGQIDIADAVYLLQYLFVRAAQPAAPFPGCGQDPTDNGLGCERPAGRGR
jgi:hypothetical protein